MSPQMNAREPSVTPEPDADLRACYFTDWFNENNNDVNNIFFMEVDPVLPLMQDDTPASASTSSPTGFGFTPYSPPPSAT